MNYYTNASIMLTVCIHCSNNCNYVSFIVMIKQSISLISHICMCAIHDATLYSLLVSIDYRYFASMMLTNQDDKQANVNHNDNNEQQDELDTANGFDIFTFTEGVNNIILLAFCIGIGIIAGIITFAIASNPMAAWHNIILFIDNHNNALRIIAGLLAIFSTIIMIADIPHDMISFILDNKNKLSLGNRPGRLIHIILPLLIIMSMTALLAWFATNIVWLVLPYSIVWLILSILLLVPSSHDDFLHENEDK